MLHLHCQALNCSVMKRLLYVQDTFLEKHNVKLGFMSAFVKASSDALHLVPAVNAVIEGDELVYRDYTDISIAVATPKGLVVPVLRNVDVLNFAGVEKVWTATSTSACFSSGIIYLWLCQHVILHASES